MANAKLGLPADVRIGQTTKVTIPKGRREVLFQNDLTHVCAVSFSPKGTFGCIEVGLDPNGKVCLGILKRTHSTDFRVTLTLKPGTADPGRPPGGTIIIES